MTGFGSFADCPLLDLPVWPTRTSYWLELVVSRLAGFGLGTRKVDVRFRRRRGRIGTGGYQNNFSKTGHRDQIKLASLVELRVSAPTARRSALRDQLGGSQVRVANRSARWTRLFLQAASPKSPIVHRSAWRPWVRVLLSAPFWLAQVQSSWRCGVPLAR